MSDLPFKNIISTSVVFHPLYSKSPLISRHASSPASYLPINTFPASSKILEAPGPKNIELLVVCAKKVVQHLMVDASGF